MSPGLVRTQFLPRCNKVDDIEEGKMSYDKMVEGVSVCMYSYRTSLSLTLYLVPLQPLEAEDIASSILYILSTPPRMQVCIIPLMP